MTTSNPWDALAGCVLAANNIRRTLTKRTMNTDDSNDYLTADEMDRIETEARDLPLVDHKGSTLVVVFLRDGQTWAMTRQQRCAALREFFKLRMMAPLSAELSLPADDWRGFAPRGVESVTAYGFRHRYRYVLRHPQDPGYVLNEGVKS